MHTMWRDAKGWSVGRITVSSLGNGDIVSNRESIVENLDFGDAISLVCMMNGADFPTSGFVRKLEKKANNEGMK